MFPSTTRDRACADRSPADPRRFDGVAGDLLGVHQPAQAAEHLGLLAP